MDRIQVVGGIKGGPQDNWGDWRGNSNISGIGANIVVEGSNNKQIRNVSGGSGTGVQDSQTVHFGLGQIQSVMCVFISWEEIL